MSIPGSRPCTLDVSFHPTPEGRPEVYDFFWHHAAKLYPEMKQKSVRVQLSLPATPKKNADTTKMHRAFLQKMDHDPRFTLTQKNIQHTHSPVLALDVTLPARELDAFLNTYNVLFEAGLSSVRLESPDIVLDFARASENQVHVATTPRHAPRVKAFIQTAPQTVPKIRAISFTLTHPFQHALVSRRKGGT